MKNANQEIGDPGKTRRATAGRIDVDELQRRGDHGSLTLDSADVGLGRGGVGVRDGTGGRGGRPHFGVVLLRPVRDRCVHVARAVCGNAATRMDHLFWELGDQQRLVDHGLLWRSQRAVVAGQGHRIWRKKLAVRRRMANLPNWPLRFQRADRGRTAYGRPGNRMLKVSAKDCQGAGTKSRPGANGLLKATAIELAGWGDERRI